MAAITVRNLPAETHRALKARAAAHGRSTEAEVRAILRDAVAEPEGAGFGTRVARAAVEVGGFDLEVERDRTISQAIDFA